MIKKYRKKPVVIEAVQWTGYNESYEEICWFMKGIYVEPLGDGKLKIPTLEGYHIASVGDYIIKGVKGEFYPCKPDIFRETYEEIKCVIKEYRKKLSGIKIEAIKWDGTIFCFKEVREFIRGVDVEYLKDCILKIPSAKNRHYIANVGDYIVKWMGRGEIRPCNPKIFKKEYEEVKDE